MPVNVLLSVSAVYMALIGIGFLVAPIAMMFGTVGPGAPAALIGLLRTVAGTFIGIAVLNWAARNAEASTARDAILLANTVGFGVAGVLGGLAVAGGTPTVELAPAAINLLIAAGFFMVGRANMSTPKS